MWLRDLAISAVEALPVSRLSARDPAHGRCPSPDMPGRARKRKSTWDGRGRIFKKLDLVPGSHRFLAMGPFGGETRPSAVQFLRHPPVSGRKRIASFDLPGAELLRSSSIQTFSPARAGVWVFGR